MDFNLGISVSRVSLTPRPRTGSSRPGSARRLNTRSPRSPGSRASPKGSPRGKTPQRATGSPSLLSGRSRMTPQVIANLDARVASTASRRLDPVLQKSLDKLEGCFASRDRAANGRLSQAEFDAAIREAAPVLGVALLGKVAGVAIAVGVRPGQPAPYERRPPIVYYDFMQMLAQHLLDEGYQSVTTPTAAAEAGAAAGRHPAPYGTHGAVRVTPGASWEQLTGSALDVEAPHRSEEGAEAEPNPFHSLHGQGLAEHVLAALRAQRQTFEAAVHILDPNGSGTILRADFRKICDHMVFNLTDSQFETLVRHMGSGTRLNYEGMLEDDAFSLSQADRAWTSLAGKVTAKLFNDGAALHKMLKRVDGQRTGMVSRKLFYSTFERWMGHYIQRKHFDRIARAVVIRRDRSHPRYTKEDKLIAFEVLFDLFDQASDAAGGGMPDPDWLTNARRPAFLGTTGTTAGGIAADAGISSQELPPAAVQTERWVNPSPDGRVPPSPQAPSAAEQAPIQMPTVALDALDFEDDGNGNGNSGGEDYLLVEDAAGADADAGSAMPTPPQHNPHERFRPNFFGHQVNEGTTGIPKGSERLQGSMFMEADTHRRIPLNNAGASGGHYNPGNAEAQTTTKWGGLYLTGKHDGQGEGETATIEQNTPSTIPKPFSSTGPSYKPKALEAWQQSEVGLNLGLRPPHAKAARQATIPVALGGTFVAEDPAPETRAPKEILLAAGMPVVDEPPIPEPAPSVVQTLTVAVTAKYDEILAEFHRRDYRRTGYLTRNDVVRVIQSICKFEVSKVAESKIFHTIDQNLTGVDIKYQEFLLKYGGELPRNRAAPVPRPKTQARPSTRRLRKTNTMKAATTMLKNGGTSSMTATALLAPSLAQLVVRNWVPLKAMFRQRDWQCEGVVDNRDFGQCLAEVGVKLGSGELKALCGRWAASGGKNGVAYVDFLRHYVKSMSANAKSDKQRLTHRTTKKALETQRTMRPDADGAFRAIEKKVLPKWTAIRRSCLKYDPKPGAGKPRSGSIKPAEFKKVLKEHGIVLSDEQFYHIHSHVDVKLATGVKYDGFFKEILGRGKTQK